MLFIGTFGYSVNYTWNGTTSTAWGTNTNWTPNGVPVAGDNVTIVLGPNNPIYNGSFGVTNITMTSGTLNLNGFMLTSTGTAIFNGGAITNGTINPTGTSNTFAGTTFGAVVNCSGNTILLNGSVFNNTSTFSKNAGGGNNGNGGNVFNGITTFNQNSGGNFRTANTTADIFNNDLYINCTSSGNVYLAENGGNTLFNGNVIITSTLSADVYFCNSAGTASLANTKSLSIGSVGFSGTSSIRFKNFTQSDATAAQIISSSSNSTTVTFLSGNLFAGDVSITAGSIYFHGSTFTGNAMFIKTGTAINDCDGGNTFSGASNTFSTSIGADRWRMANVNPDVFNNTTFTHEGANNFIVARQTLGNIFNGTTTFNSNTAGGVFVSRGNTSANASATFNGPVVVNVQLTGNVTFAEGSAAINNSCVFNSSIQLNSSATSVGDIIFGGSNTNNSNTLNSGAAFIAGSINGQTNVYLRNVVQSGATNQVINTVGSSGVLYIGGVNSLTSIYPCTFAGNCVFSADTAGYISSGTFGADLTFNVTNGNGYLQTTNVGGNLNMSAATPRIRNNNFAGTAFITQTGASNSTSNGGNTFAGNATINVTGTGALRLASYASDVYQSSATFVQTSTGLMLPVYSNTVSFAGNISTVGSNSVVTFGTASFAGITVGTGLQIIDGPVSFPPAFNYLRTNHTGTLQLNKSININSVFDMVQGLVNLNSNTLTLGTAGTAANAGALNYTSGWLYGGAFKRWQYNTSYAIANSRGHFPMGTSQSDYRPLWIAYSSNLSSVGAVLVTHNPVYAATYFSATHNDASWGNTLQGVSNSSWVVSTSNGLNFNGSSAIIRFGGTGFTPFVLTDLNASFLASVTGTHGAATNVNTALEVNRTAISTANIANTWHIGTRNITQSPLPIELVGFNAEMKDKVVLCTWVTASEKDNKAFSVERSKDALNFEEVGLINGKGDSFEYVSYTFTDKTPYDGISYYRLKQIDIDGSIDYSSSVSVTNAINTTPIVFPNPVSSEFYVNENKQTIKTIKIFDCTGKLVHQIQSPEKGKSINLEFLQKGVYFIQLTRFDETHQIEKLIKD